MEDELQEMSSLCSSALESSSISESAEETGKAAEGGEGRGRRDAREEEGKGGTMML